MIHRVKSALQLTFPRRAYRFLTLGIFALALAFYLFTLPAAYTGGQIGLVSLHHLNAVLLFFAVAFSALLSVVLAFNIYAFRASVQHRGTGLSLAAVISSLLPSSVCCTSLVPSLLAVLGASTPQIFGLAGQIQGIFATNEVAFLAFAFVLLLGSLNLAARNLCSSCILLERSTTPNEPA
jgi:hypothetical protein